MTTTTATRSYLNEQGDMRIPFDADPRYHFWKEGGQTILTTLTEIGAEVEIIARYTKRVVEIANAE